MVLNLASFIATRISLICFNKMFTFVRQLGRSTVVQLMINDTVSMAGFKWTRT